MLLVPSYLPGPSAPSLPGWFHSYLGVSQASLPLETVSPWWKELLAMLPQPRTLLGGVPGTCADGDPSEGPSALHKLLPKFLGDSPGSNLVRGDGWASSRVDALHTQPGPWEPTAIWLQSIYRCAPSAHLSLLCPPCPHPLGSSRELALGGSSSSSMLTCWKNGSVFSSLALQEKL